MISSFFVIIVVENYKKKLNLFFARIAGIRLKQMDNFVHTAEIY